MTSDTPVPAAPVPSDAAAGSAAGQRGGPARRRIWWISATLAWAVLLGTLAYLSVGRDEPTVREQRSLEAAVPVVRRALGDLITAAGPETVVEVTAVRVQEGCRLTLFWDGAALEQSVLFRTADPDALLDRIADRLPSRYQAAVRRTDGGQHMLRAEAGEFVGVKGHATGPDTVTVTAATGCRPTGGAAPDSTVRTPVDAEPGRLLAALGATRVEPGEPAEATCPDGTARTLRAAGRGRPARPLGEALGPVVGSDAVVVIDRADLYAYRSGSLSVVVESTDGELRVTATHGC